MLFAEVESIYVLQFPVLISLHTKIFDMFAKTLYALHVPKVIREPSPLILLTTQVFLIEKKKTWHFGVGQQELCLLGKQDFLYLFIN